ncbi:hypothetical protein TWF506_006254 [Arthrobotrys conoides]|uniref:F-box domain-containing protein n=1 Tax=Arthrobotrys conoides TaxID=74498 RepID=A0AAN8RV24_9PEZI
MEPTPESVPAPLSIINIPQELLSEIIVYLSLHERAALLRTCKSLHHHVYPHLWQTIDSNIRPMDAREVSDITLTMKKVIKLAEITEELGADALGFRHVKELRFGSNDLQGYSPWIKTGLLDVICDQIITKKMEIVRVKLNWEKLRESAECVITFLQMLKSYSELNIQRPSIIAVQNAAAYTFPFDLFALECLSSLRIGFKTNIASTSTIEQLIEEISIFTKVLTGAVSLTNLSIEGKRFLEDSACPIAELQPHLSQFQDAIANLKQLSTLELSLMIFHPSFFIVPPQNVKKLVITLKVSVEWWRQFARCPLLGVEQLRIYAHHVERKHKGKPSTWWSSSDPEANQADPGDFIFKLNDLAVKGLKKFETNCNSYYCPEDFLELVVQNNPGLDEEQRQKYLDMHRDWQARPRTFLLHGERTRWDIDPKTGQPK